MNKNIWIPKLNYYSKRLSMWQEKLWREVNGKPFMGILDNIAGRKTFEYATFGMSGVQQANSKLFTMQMATSSFPYGVTSAAGAGGGGDALTTTIDRGRWEYDIDSTGPYYVYGYAVSNEWWENVAGFGTMASSTYTDGASVSQTIKGIVDYDSGGNGAAGMVFSLDGTSRGDTDTQWLDITWDDSATVPRTVTRATDLITYTASLNGSTHYRDTAPPYDWTDLDAGTDFVLTTS